MIKLPYSLVIEATDEDDFFGFYSPDLEGFAGIGHSIEDCVFRAGREWPNTYKLCASRDSKCPIKIQIQRF